MYESPYKCKLPSNCTFERYVLYGAMNYTRGYRRDDMKKKQTPARKADNNETCVQRRRDMKPLSPRITDSLIFALSRRSIEWNIFNHSPRESVEKYLCINCERTNCIVWVGRERQLIRVMYVIVLLHVYVLLRSEWAIWVVKLKYVLSFTYCVVTYGVSDFQRRISLNSKNGTIEIT